MRKKNKRKILSANLFSDLEVINLHHKPNQSVAILNRMFMKQKTYSPQSKWAHDTIPISHQLHP